MTDFHVYSYSTKGRHANNHSFVIIAVVVIVILLNGILIYIIWREGPS